MNEEKYLEERMAKQNPFKVPEGYFDSFAEHVMQQLPQRQAQGEAHVAPSMDVCGCQSAGGGIQYCYLLLEHKF